ncbi:MAG: hypothetical protein WCA21_12745 [Terracidiphilus sp.]
MSSKMALIVLQSVGGLSILVSPLVLIFALCFWDDPHAPEYPLYLIGSYPFAGVGLYLFSWLAISRGYKVLAISISAIPALVTMIVIGVVGKIVFVEHNNDIANTIEQAKKLSEVQSESPVLWAVWCEDNCRPPMPVEQVLQTIETNPSLVNTTLPDSKDIPEWWSQGTPLDMTVDMLPIKLDGSPIGDGRRLQDRIRVVRALVAHGAHLSSNGNDNDLVIQWKLKMALNDKPNNTASENPLVWRIITTDWGKGGDFSLNDSDKPFLSKRTQLYGTPLNAAMLRSRMNGYDEVDSDFFYYTPFRVGARLSKEEERDPAVSAVLKHIAAKNSNIQWPYVSSSQ